MENGNTTEQDLYRQIEAELSFCDGSTTPLICANLQTPEAKQTLIQTIAKTCLEGRIGISQAIIEVERLYSASDID